MLCWACRILEAQAAVAARCHGILQQQMGWWSVQSGTKDVDVLFAGLLHAAVQSPVPDANIIAFGTSGHDPAVLSLESPGTRVTTLPSGGYSQRSYGHAANCYSALTIPLGMQEALVRDTAVTALLELYADEDNVEPMHELTARFAPRFAQLIHDVDEGVAVKGVRQHPLQQPSSQHFHIQMHL